MKWHFMMELGIVLLLLLVGRYLIGCVVGRSALFPAPAHAVLPQAPGGSFIQLDVNDRIIRGYLIRPSSVTTSDHRLIVFFHGNGATMDGDADLGLLFARHGFTSLLVEYPGYGLSSDSSPSESRIYEDADALIRYVQSEQRFDPSRTVLFGHSLGSAVAAEMARRGLASRIVLLSPFTSAPAVGGHHFMPALLKWLPSFLMCDRFDTRAKASSIMQPVFIVHGRQDTIIPFEMGEQLSKSFPNARFMPVEGADHNDLFMYLNAEQWDHIVRFAGL